MQLSPYHTGLAGRHLQRLPESPASLACCCPLRLSPSGKPDDPRTFLRVPPDCVRDTTPRSAARGLPASGSSSHDFATSAIRWHCVDTCQVSVYLPCFQQAVHETASPSLARVPQVGSPGSTVLWDTPTPCRPSRRTSFPSLGDTIVASVVRPPPAPDAGPWINLELVGGISGRLARWKRQGLPSSQGNPCDHSSCSPTPA
jgi:hypothetical protein